jgi:alkylation response protein AidB-like acyl-CoA dehydrogenase
VNLAEFRPALDAWLEAHAAELSSPSAAGSLDDHMAHLSHVKRLVYDADWMRWGWPASVGGLGGSALLRGYLGEALTMRDFVLPGPYSTVEVLAPTVIDYASPALAAEMVPRLLRGDETWCQGFSEPSTGSNLGALTCRALRAEDTWVVTGQKVWTSLAQYAQRCVLLVRTGTPESAHRGITALFVDMDTPGITVRPLEAMHGAPEFSEVFFDDVVVPVSRTLGDEGQGWAVAMDILPHERSTAMWFRAALLYHRFDQVLAAGPDLSASAVGEAFLDLFAFRERSRATQYRFDAGETLGPETSIDKILNASAEQTVYDLAADGLTDEVLFGDGHWRSEFLYSRAAPIYGGSAEIQRNIVARRLLDLGADR